MANVKDGATGTVLTAPSPATSGTSIVLNSGEGARFPTAPFYIIAHPDNTIPTVSTAEKLLVTGISTDTLTVVRAQGIYTAKSVAVGWRISNAIFQDDFNNASFIRNEVPGGLVNSANTIYTVASATGMLTGSLDVYKNGLRLKGGGVDFTQTTTGFTATSAPASGAILLVDYIVAGVLNNVGTNSLITIETPTGSVNSSNTVFTLARAYIAGSLEVYINGLKQKRVTDYTETTPSTGTFTMATAPVTGDTIFVDYQFNLNPASNSDTVDGIHASVTPTANQLFPLNSTNKYAATILANPYKFAAYSTVAQNSGNAAFAKTNFATEEYDTGSNYDTSTSTFTAPEASFYHFDAGVCTNAGATTWLIAVFKNGSEWKRGNQFSYATALNALSTVSIDMQLAANDTVDVRTFGDSARAINVTQQTCYFMGRLTSST